MELGFKADDAKNIVLQTMQGAISLLKATGSNPEAEIDKVTTPGGMTIRGLNAMEQAGFTNAVAPLGTAFTETQAMLLKRYTKEVILSFDSDSAGNDAAVRALPILRENGIRARVLSMSPFKDPDELIKAKGPEEYRRRIKEAEPGRLFEIRLLCNQYRQDDPDSRLFRFFMDYFKDYTTTMPLFSELEAEWPGLVRQIAEGNGIGELTAAIDEKLNTRLEAEYGLHAADME